jgi:hypothetical protein
MQRRTHTTSTRRIIRGPAALSAEEAEEAKNAGWSYSAPRRAAAALSGQPTQHLLEGPGTHQGTTGHPTEDRFGRWSRSSAASARPGR